MPPPHSSSSNDNVASERHHLIPSRRITPAIKQFDDDGSSVNNQSKFTILYKVCLILGGVLFGMIVSWSVHHPRQQGGQLSGTTIENGQQEHPYVDPIHPGYPVPPQPSSRDHFAPSSASTTSTNKRSSKYKRFQPLGFQIYTGGAPAFLTRLHHGVNETIPNPECQELNSFGHIEGQIQCYMGLLDQYDDVDKRLWIMEEAVERAAEVSDPDEETLKIFIAPEFFWRGKDGAYVFDEEREIKDHPADQNCTEVCRVMSGLERIAGQARYKDWLFLFGTVIASEVLPLEDKYDYLFYNFAPMYKGYDASQYKDGQIPQGKRFIIPKRYVSNIDFLTPRRHFDDDLAKELMQFEGPVVDQRLQTTEDIEGGFESSVVLNPFNIDQKKGKYDRRMWHDYKDELTSLGYTMIEYDWLIVDDITFTVEVCLDHDLKTALNTYLVDAIMGSTARIPSSNDVDGLTYVPIPKHQAQISLVSSAGMTVNPDSMALVNNGTIILQDGENNDEVRMSYQDECQMYSWHFTGGSEAVQRTGIMSPTEAVFKYNVDSKYVKYSIFDDWVTAIDGVFTTRYYEPMITVYQTMDIAPAL